MGGAAAEVSRHDHRDPARVGVLRAERHRPDVEAARPALRGERALRARRRSEQRRQRRGARDGAVRAGRGGAAGRRARSTCIPKPIERGAHHRAHRAGQPAARHRAVRRRHRGLPHAARHRDARRRRRSVPTFRPDLEREIDLVEEVARRVGLDRIARTVPVEPGEDRRAQPRASATGARSPTCSSAPATTRCTRCRCSRPADLASAGLRAEAVIEVENPLRAEESILRPALLPGLLRAVAYNAAHGEPDVALFESGTRVRAARCRRAACRPSAVRSRSPRAHHVAARAARTGSRRSTSTTRPRRSTRSRRSSASPTSRLEAARVDGFHPTRAARVLVDGEPVGVVGEVAADGRRRARARRARWSRARSTSTRSSPAARDRRVARPGVALPGVDRRPRVRRRRHDSRRGDRSARCVEAGGELLEHVALFDVFRSDALGPGKVSLAFALRFRAARPHAHRRRGRARCARQCIDAVVVGPRRRAAELSDERPSRVHAPDPRALRRDRRAGRRVQRALADLLRRLVHAVHGVARLRARVLDRSSST